MRQIPKRLVLSGFVLICSSNIFAMKLSEFVLSLLALPVMSYSFSLDTLTDEPFSPTLIQRNDTFLTCWGGYSKDTQKNGIWCHDLPCKPKTKNKTHCDFTEPTDQEQKIASTYPVSGIFLSCSEDTCQAYASGPRNPWDHKIEISGSSFIPGIASSLRTQKWTIEADTQPNIVFTKNKEIVIYKKDNVLMAANLGANGLLQSPRAISEDAYPSNVELAFPDFAIGGEELFNFAVAFVGNEDKNSLDLNIYLAIVDHDGTLTKLKIQNTEKPSFLRPNYPRLALIDDGMVVVYQLNFKEMPQLFAQRIRQKDGEWIEYGRPILLEKKQGPYFKIASNGKNLLGLTKQADSYGPGSMTVFDLEKNGKIVLSPVALGPLADLGQMFLSVGKPPKMVETHVSWSQKEKRAILKFSSRYIPSKRTNKGR